MQEARSRKTRSKRSREKLENKPRIATPYAWKLTLQTVPCKTIYHNDPIANGRPEMAQLLF